MLDVLQILPKVQNNAKIVVWPNDPHNNRGSRVITPHDSRKSWQAWDNTYAIWKPYLFWEESYGQG